MFPLKLVNPICKSILFFGICTLAFPKDLIAQEKEPKNFLSFGVEEGLLTEDIGTYPELKTWALYQFYELDEDHPAFGLQDSVCRMIPENGLKFTLIHEKDQLKPVYLILDLTKYRPTAKARFKTRSLSVFVNGKELKTVHVSKGKGFENPVRIPLEPSSLQGGRANILLKPSQNEVGRFWGIWDAFLTQSDERL